MDVRKGIVGLGTFLLVFTGTSRFIAKSNFVEIQTKSCVDNSLSWDFFENFPNPKFTINSGDDFFGFNPRVFEKPLLVSHKVRPGESPSVIARKYDVPLDSVLKKNPDVVPEKLAVGEVLKVEVPNPYGFDIDEPEENFDMLRGFDGEEVYNCLDSYGKHVFAGLIGTKPGRFLVDRGKTLALLEKYAPLFEVAANKYEVSKLAGQAIFFQESGGLENSISTSGHLGPMGLEDTIARGGVWPDGIEREWINPFDVEKAIDRGMDFFSYLYKRYGNEELAFTAYNRGETAVNSAIISAARDYGFTYTEKENKSKFALEFMKRNFQNYAKLIVEVKKDGKYLIPQEGRDYYDNILEKKRYVKANKGKRSPQRIRLTGAEMIAFNDE